MDSLKSMLVAVTAMRSQAARMRDVADELALRLASMGRDEGYDAPVQLFDAELGYDFREIYMPGHPAANERGYVRAEDFSVVPAAEPGEVQLAYEAQLDAMKEAFEAEADELADEESSDEEPRQEEQPQDESEDLGLMYG